MHPSDSEDSLVVVVLFLRPAYPPDDRLVGLEVAAGRLADLGLLMFRETLCAIGLVRHVRSSAQKLVDVNLVLCSRSDAKEHWRRCRPYRAEVVVLHCVQGLKISCLVDCKEPLYADHVLL